MIVEFDGTHLPIKSWCHDIEIEALKQAKNLAKLPFAFKQICLMPDAHAGFGMPIGGVLACKGAIIPNAVGVDIGCGMRAIETTLYADDITSENINKILQEIKKVIPIGNTNHNIERDNAVFNWAPRTIPIIRNELPNAKRAIGTLGSGNHFIEIQKATSTNVIWIMIHSGSRNFGFKIANEYHNIAKNLCETYYSNIPTMDLAFLPQGSSEYREYFIAMKYAIAFAYANRAEIDNNICSIFDSIFNNKFDIKNTYDVRHNYASLENHFNNNVVVHRKGAISAKKGEIGIIPGSQGTYSYIVKGKGNKESFMSCSHGAGRKMSRTRAIKELNFKAEVEKLNAKGIIHSVKCSKNLDEAVGAYKDINIVMQEQADLVDIVEQLEPIAVIKG